MAARASDLTASEWWQKQASDLRDSLASELVELYNKGHLTISQARETASDWGVSIEFEKIEL